MDQVYFQAPINWIENKAGLLEYVVGSISIWLLSHPAAYTSNMKDCKQISARYYHWDLYPLKFSNGIINFDHCAHFL